MEGLSVCIDFSLIMHPTSPKLGEAIRMTQNKAVVLEHFSPCPPSEND